jgi:hypothetical protein
MYVQGGNSCFSGGLKSEIKLAEKNRPLKVCNRRARTRYSSQTLIKTTAESFSLYLNEGAEKDVKRKTENESRKETQPYRREKRVFTKVPF